MSDPIRCAFGVPDSKLSKHDRTLLRLVALRIGSKLNDAEQVIKDALDANVCACEGVPSEEMACIIYLELIDRGILADIER